MATPHFAISVLKSLPSLLLIGLALIFAPCAGADTTDNGIKDFTIRQGYLSVRAMGMGNSFTALADDYNTLFYNPAGLARLEAGQIDLGLLQAHVDTKAPKFYNDIQTAAGGSDATKAQNMSDLLEKNYGNHYSARLMGPSAFWVRPNWGFAFIPAELNMELEIRRLGVAAMNVNAIADSTLAYGRGWDVNWFSGTRVSLGITAKAIYRAAYQNSILGSDLAFNSSILRVEDAREGLTADADVGMLISPAAEASGWGRLFRPTVGLTARNVVDYGFTSNFHLVNKNSTGEPPKLGRRYDVGFMWQLPQWWIFKVRAMADLRDMGDPNWAFGKGYHAGTEFQWKIWKTWQGAWRVGINQGYFTAGFSGRLAIFNLDLATYAEETGTTTTPNANRRYMAKASLDW